MIPTRELPTLALRLLGVKPPFPFSFKKPGPSHKARFMAFCIFCLKMLLLIQQLDLDEWTREGLVRLGVFFAIVYVPHFLKSSVGADAAVNDLYLYKQLVRFIDVDGPIATAALEVLSRHGWYTAEETVTFCLCSNKLSNDEKSRVAARILSYDTPESVTLQAWASPPSRSSTRRPSSTTWWGPRATRSSPSWAWTTTGCCRSPRTGTVSPSTLR